MFQTKLPCSKRQRAVWRTPFTPENAKQAVFMFNGDVLKASPPIRSSRNKSIYLQQHVRLFSGLYGVLRPLDFVQPYRLKWARPLPTRAVKPLRILGR